MKRVFLLLLAACAPPAVPDDGGPHVSGSPLWPDGTLQLGLVDSEGLFTPFGQTFALIHGPQGGSHVPLAYQVRGRTADNALFVLRVRRERDGVLVYRNETRFSVTGEVWTDERRAFLCPPLPGVTLVNELLSFEVIVIGEGGEFFGTATVHSTTFEPQCG